MLPSVFFLSMIFLPTRKTEGVNNWDDSVVCYIFFLFQ
jgi:hypothetical protein